MDPIRLTNKVQGEWKQRNGCTMEASRVLRHRLKSILSEFKNFLSRCGIEDSLIGNGSDLVDVLRRIHVSSWIVIPLLLLILKRQCPDYAHARASSVFSSKDIKTVILTRQDVLLDRTADGDLLFTFSSNILDFRRSLSSYLKFGE